MDTRAQDVEAAQRLIDLHFEIWNDTDKAARIARFAKVYAPEFFVADHSGRADGFTEVNRLIDKVQSEHTGFLFTTDPISWNYGLGRVTWGYGPKEQPNLIPGEDIFTIRDGRLSSAHVVVSAASS